MAEKAKKNNKNLIIGACVAVVAIVVIVVAVIFATSSPKLDDAFFKSSDTKYVMAMDSSAFETEDGEIKPAKAYVVYNYSGDKIGSAFTYIEFADASTAKKALDLIKSQEDIKEGAKSVNTNDKYVVIEMKEETYKDLTVEMLKFYDSFLSDDDTENNNYDYEESVDEEEK